MAKFVWNLSDEQYGAFIRDCFNEPVAMCQGWARVGDTQLEFWGGTKGRPHELDIRVRYKDEGGISHACGLDAPYWRISEVTMTETITLTEDLTLENFKYLVSRLVSDCKDTVLAPHFRSGNDTFWETAEALAQSQKQK